MHRGNSGFIRPPAGAVREHAKCFRRLALLPAVSSKTVRPILHNPIDHGAAVFGAAHQTFHQH
jgi:hypothetical protein